MQLSKFTDYALRVLMHLATAEGHLLTTRQISEMHDTKFNHLSKVTQWLVREGFAESVRGRNGGLRLAKPARDINIGAIMRQLESQQNLVECFQPNGGQCVLLEGCGLKAVLHSAEQAFFEVLDQKTLEDLTANNRTLGLVLKQLVEV